MSKSPDKTTPLELALSISQRDILKQDLLSIVYPGDGFNRYVDSIKEASHHLKSILSPLRHFLASDVHPDERPGAIKITNLPISEYGEKPPLNHANLVKIDKTNYISENILTAVAVQFGEPYSMHCEGRGLINNLIPTRSTSSQVTGLGADSDLRFHAENSALRFITGNDCSPSALLLTGVKQESNPPRTRLSDARLALKLVSDTERTILQSPLYAVKLPYRWRGYAAGYDTLHTRMIPLIEEDRNGLIVHAAFYGDMISYCANVEAERAAKAFEEALESVAHDEVIAPGELIAIDNRTTLHARTPFKASFDEEGRAQRWVQRLFISRDLGAFSDWATPNERVFAPTFDSSDSNALSA
jgi:L-asparagine oxygenase